MGALAPEELEMLAVRPVWKALDAVAAFEAGLTRFLVEELLPAGARFDAVGMSLANELANEFRWEIWPHRVPLQWELVLAVREGRLDQRVAELNAEFVAGGGFELD